MDVETFKATLTARLRRVLDRGQKVKSVEVFGVGARVKHQAVVRVHVVRAAPLTYTVTLPSHAADGVARLEQAACVCVSACNAWAVHAPDRGA